MPSIKGTASVSSTRALEKALQSTKFPACFSQKVDLAKINRPVLTQWIEKRITELLGFEDEIVQSTAANLFLPTAPEDSSMVPTVDPRTAQVDLTGFLGEEGSSTFARELWELMLDAQEQAAGVPRKLLEGKKKELAMQQQQQGQRNQPRPPPPPPAPHGDRRGRYRDDRDIQRYESAARPVSPPYRGNDSYHNEYRRRGDGDRRPYDESQNRWNRSQERIMEQQDEFGRRVPLPQRFRDELTDRHEHDARVRRRDQNRRDATGDRGSSREDDYYNRRSRPHDNYYSDRAAGDQYDRDRHRDRASSRRRSRSAERGERRVRRRRSRSVSSASSHTSRSSSGSSSTYSSSASSSYSSASSRSSRGRRRDHHHRSRRDERRAASRDR